MCDGKHAWKGQAVNPAPQPPPTQVTTPSSNAHGSGGGSKAQSTGVGESSGATADFLENTLWNRTLGATSEEIVAALVCQIFEGACIRGRLRGDRALLPRALPGFAAWGPNIACLD